jgi:SAM-dependent methyltransferase
VSRADSEKWNKRYREGAYADRTHPSALLAEWLPQLALPVSRPRAIDIACGNGRNSVYLARNGFEVTAVDISEVALEGLGRKAAAEGLPITCVQADLEEDEGQPEGLFAAGWYDLAIMIRYTNLPLIASLKTALRPGGYLVVEEHLVTEADVIGPQNPRFRVAPGALREAAAGLEVIACQEGIVQDPDQRLAALARLVARRPA